LPQATDEAPDAVKNGVRGTFSKAPERGKREPRIYTAVLLILSVFLRSSILSVSPIKSIS